jgi:multidrug resistance efflux pump
MRQSLFPVAVFATVVGVLIMLWGSLSSGGIPGIAEGRRSVVTCPQTALLQELKVRPYDWVEAGQPIATLQPTDPRAKLDLLQSELALARLKLEPSLSDQNALDYERLRVESLRLKQEVAVAEVELQRAESALRRGALLREDKLVSEDAYDLNLRDRDRYRVEAAEKRKALETIESRLTALCLLGEPANPGSNQQVRPFTTSLDAKFLAAGTNWDSLTLVAPMSGMVQWINRQPGEYLAEGEILLTINSPKADRIVCYLRQPYALEPAQGMKVEVLTRSHQRQTFLAEVAQVGAQVEVITNALAVIRPFTTVDTGLPVVIQLPPEVNVRPGETFDVRFLTGASPSPASPGDPSNSTPVVLK